MPGAASPHGRSVTAVLLAVAGLVAAGIGGCAEKVGSSSTGSPAATQPAGPSPAGTVPAATGKSGAPAYPSSMDALGASTTRGYSTDCPTAWIDCPGNSWATGTNPAVNSVYLRLLTLKRALEDNNANDAESGSRMADLPTQADSAVHRQADLVLIATGIYDACGGPDGRMTTVSSFAASFTSALDRLTTGPPDARTLVSSIPGSLPDLAAVA